MPFTVYPHIRGHIRTVRVCAYVHTVCVHSSVCTYVTCMIHVRSALHVHVVQFTVHSSLRHTYFLHLTYVHISGYHIHTYIYIYIYNNYSYSYSYSFWIHYIIHYIVHSIYTYTIYS